MHDTHSNHIHYPGIAPLSDPVYRKPIGQHVFERLKTAIMEGKIPHGTQLIENRIAEEMQISRTPVREALHKLEREGYITKHAKRSFTVTRLTRADVEETFGIRSVLESYAARLAAIKHQKDELEPLVQKIDEYQKCCENGNIDDLTRINTEFHDILYSLSRSPKLVKMINDLRDQICQFRQIILRQETLAKASNEDHRLMLEYIRKKDADGVEKIVREHILRGQDAVLREFDGG